MHNIKSKQLTGKQATEQLGLSLRQVRRLIASFQDQGALGLVHANGAETLSSFQFTYDLAGNRTHLEETLNLPASTQDLAAGPA